MKHYMQKYFPAVMAVTLLLTMTACSDRQPPAEEVKSSSESISASVTEPPVKEASSAADAPETVSESDPTQENVQTPEKKRVDTEFEIDTVKFKLALPEGWMAKGNEIYADDVKIAELLPFVPNDDGKAFEALDAQYADAVAVKDVTAGAHFGKYYHMQSEKEVGGVTAKQNELMYYFEIKESYLEIGNSLLHFAFYPVHGTGIGTQRETFEAMLNTIETENKAQFTDSKDVAIDHNNFDAIFSKYVAPIAPSGLLFKTWNTPEDLAANKLIDFYGYNQVYLDEKYIGADANTPVEIHRSVVESFIRQHFIVSTEHLQTSDYYETSEQSYILIVGGRGGGAMPIITEVQQDEKNLSISLEPNPEDGGSSYRVILNVSIDAESWKYESCSYNIL